MNGFLLDSDMKTRNVVEKVTGGLIVTESDHTAIHKGYGYRLFYDVSNLSAGGEVNICMSTGVDCYTHYKNIQLSVLGASCQVQILKEPLVTLNTGTILTPVNLNTVSNKLSKSTFRLNPTFTGGVVLDRVSVLLDTTNQVVGSGQSSVLPYEELVLDQSEKYIIKIKNIRTSDTIISASLKFFYYEEPRGEF
jgi:hypothetical protein